MFSIKCTRYINYYWESWSMIPDFGANRSGNYDFPKLHYKFQIAIDATIERHQLLTYLQKFIASKCVIPNEIL